ncbi:MAG: regulatory protein TetR [Actinomycetia bacterium]|nr:regulatory protein TetR [Actinomycetes bacterium]
MAQDTGGDCERLRVDAARNRDRILDAARLAFAEHGTDVALEEIARQAGVGIATLYRRFPTRAELFAAAFEPRKAAYIEATQVAQAEPDPWLAFSGFVRTVSAMQAADCGFADVLALNFPTTPELDRELRRATTGIGDVIERAQAAGVLRADFVLQDLVLLHMANAGVINATKKYAPKAWERFTTYMLDSFRAPGASELPKPMTRSRLALAVRRSGRP